jgi:hypothetical protein
LSNAPVPGTATVLLTAANGHLFLLDTTSNAFTDQGLPPQDPAAPAGYVAGFIGSPQLDTTATTGPQFNVLTSDGRIVQVNLAAPSVTDLGADPLANLPFVRNPVALSVSGTVGVIAATATNGQLFFGTMLNGSFTWLSPDTSPRRT